MMIILSIAMMMMMSNSTQQKMADSKEGKMARACIGDAIVNRDARSVSISSGQQPGRYLGG